jgi:hypothetical protein
MSIVLFFFFPIFLTFLDFFVRLLSKHIQKANSIHRDTRLTEEEEKKIKRKKIIKETK